MSTSLPIRSQRPLTRSLACCAQPGLKPRERCRRAQVRAPARRTSVDAASGRWDGPARSRARSFFTRDPLTIEEPRQGSDPVADAAFRKTGLELDKRDVALLPQHHHDLLGMDFCL